MTLPPLLSSHALFLDFDGTLVDIAARPDAIRVDPSLPDLLQRVSDRLEGALALVTGRPIGEIDRHLRNGKLAVAGLHGLEYRFNTGGVRQVDVPEEVLATGRRVLRRFAEGRPGVLLEDKRLAIALHFRGDPEAEQACLDVVLAAAAAAGGQLEILNGKMLFELKPAGVDKGKAVERFLAVAPFCGRVPIFVGDDVTDEHGFETVNRLGGLSIRVGNGGYSNARWRTDSVATLLDWLRRFTDEAGQK